MLLLDVVVLPLTLLLREDWDVWEWRLLRLEEEERAAWAALTLAAARCAADATSRDS